MFAGDLSHGNVSAQEPRNHQHYGFKDVTFRAKNADSMRIHFGVTDVKGPILATDTVNAAGCDVILPRNGCPTGPHIRQGGRQLNLVQRAGLIFLQAMVVTGIRRAPEPQCRTTPSTSELVR
jgi:hypothetical protein